MFCISLGPHLSTNAAEPSGSTSTVRKGGRMLPGSSGHNFQDLVTGDVKLKETNDISPGHLTTVFLLLPRQFTTTHLPTLPHILRDRQVNMATTQPTISAALPHNSTHWKKHDLLGRTQNSKSGFLEFSSRLSIFFYSLRYKNIDKDTVAHGDVLRIHYLITVHFE